MTVGTLISTLIAEGLEHFNLYYGDYEAIVADNDDPDNRGRLKLSCPAIFGDSVPDIWALPKGMFSGKNIGFYAMPQIGDPVWISFRRGKAEFPIWSYGWIPIAYAPEQASRDVYLIQTPKGYKIALNESTGEIKISFTDNSFIRVKDKISIQADGESLFSLLDGVLQQLLIAQNIVTPVGPGEFNPAVKQILTDLKTKMSKLLE